MVGALSSEARLGEQVGQPAAASQAGHGSGAKAAKRKLLQLLSDVFAESVEGGRDDIGARTDVDDQTHIGLQRVRHRVP